MNFKITILCLLVTIVIGGCSPDKNSHNISGSQQRNSSSQIVTKNERPAVSSYIDEAKYNGKWISSDYQIVQMDGYTARFGSELYLEIKRNGAIQMNMYDISAPPANRIASLETEAEISPDGAGNFTFNDDGWGSHGNGTIELHDDQVIVNVNSETGKENDPDWRIYGGKRVFQREKISQNNN